MELQIGAMLAALAAVTFAARPFGRRDLPVVAGAFVLTAAALAPAGIPPLALLGTFIALVAAIELARPAWRVPAAFGAGAVAACWAAALHALGLELAPAWVLAATLLTGTLVLVLTHPRLRSAHLREEALLIVAGYALLAAAGPVVLAGWESAGAFKAQPLEGGATPSSFWLVVFVGACVAIGASYVVWRRR